MYVTCFTNILTQNNKTTKPHKPPTFSKTQNFQYPLRIIESKIKEIPRTKYVNSPTKKDLDYIAHSM